MSTLLEICKICNYSYMQNMYDMQYIQNNMSNNMQFGNECLAHQQTGVLLYQIISFEPYYKY